MAFPDTDLTTQWTAGENPNNVQMNQRIDQQLNLLAQRYRMLDAGLPLAMIGGSHTYAAADLAGTAAPYTAYYDVVFNAAQVALLSGSGNMLCLTNPVTSAPQSVSSSYGVMTATGFRLYLARTDGKVATSVVWQVTQYS